MQSIVYIAIFLMFRKSNQSVFQFIIALVVLVIIGVALTLSGLAVAENLRFIRATDQLFQIVNLVRATAATQKDFAQTVGTDILADLAHTGQILPSTINPWWGDTHVTLSAANMMRLETDLPSHECRRLALYFVGYQPSDIGLLGVQAHVLSDTVWVPIYPALPHVRSANQLETACGKASTGRLALIFQVR